MLHLFSELESMAGMKDGLPALACFAMAVGFFAFSIRLRRLRLSAKPPLSRAGFSLQERQKKIRLAAWLCMGLGVFSLIGAICLELLNLRR